MKGKRGSEAYQKAWRMHEARLGRSFRPKREATPKEARTGEKVKVEIHGEV